MVKKAICPTAIFGRLRVDNSGARLDTLFHVIQGRLFPPPKRCCLLGEPNESVRLVEFVTSGMDTVMDGLHLLK
jgi:hypothetical protein